MHRDLERAQRALAHDLEPRQAARPRVGDQPVELARLITGSPLYRTTISPTRTPLAALPRPSAATTTFELSWRTRTPMVPGTTLSDGSCTGRGCCLGTWAHAANAAASSRIALTGAR